MSDLDRAKQALIAADEAGDVEAAKSLAEYIRQSEQQPQQNEISKIGALSNVVSAGATLNLAPTLQGAAAAGYVGGRNLLGMDTGGLTAGEAFQGAEQMARQELSQSRDQLPWYQELPAEIAGAALTGLGAARRLPNITQGITNYAARGIPQSLAASAGVAGVSGGIYDAGGAQGTAQERVLEGLRSAPLYSLAGPAGLLSGKAVGGLYGRAKNLMAKRTAQKAAKQIKPSSVTDTQAIALNELAEQAMPDVSELGTVSQKAAQKVGKAIQADFPEQAADALTAAQREQGAAVLELASPRIRRLAQGAGQYKEGGAVMRQYFGSRLSETPERIFQSIKNNIWDGDAFQATVDDVVAAGREKAAPFYKAAYEAPFQPSPKLIELTNRPSGKRALALGYKIAKDEGINLDENSFAVFDYAKRGLDSMVEGARDGATGRLNLKDPKIRAINQLRTDFVEELKVLNPSYSEALQESGDYLTTSSMMQDGLKFDLIDPEKLGKKLSTMNDADKTAFRVGVAKRLRDIVDKKIEGSNPYNQLVGSSEKKKRLAQILTPKQYKSLMGTLNAENRLFEMRNQVLGGSRTAENALAAADIASLDSEMLNAVARGPSGIVPAVLSWVGKKFDGINEEGSKQIAQLLTATAPEDKLKIISGLAQNNAIGKKQARQIKQAYFTVQQSIDNIVESGNVGGLVGASTAGAIAAPQSQPVQTNQYGEPIIDITPTRQN
jgi:hypothetical protein